MSTGNLIVLLILAAGVFAMFSMHRGGSRSHGMGGGCGGHGHAHGSSDDPGGHDSSEESGADENKSLLGKPGAHAHDREPATQGGRRRGC